MGLAAIQNIDHTVIFCADLAGMRDFYSRILGLSIEHERAKWITLRVGATRLSLAAPLPGQRRPSTEGPTLQLAFRVPPSALDGCFAELKQHGVRIEREPHDVADWRHRAIFFRDPEGNRLEIYAEL